MEWKILWKGMKRGGRNGKVGTEGKGKVYWNGMLGNGRNRKTWDGREREKVQEW